MLRSLYRRLLDLHPPGFRHRFADEMLSIFDQARAKRAAAGLLVDALVSLVRQWTLRPEFWQDVSPAPTTQAATNGIPTFHTIDPFRPRTAAVIHGLVLSTAVFCLTCFAIRYSWIHVLHVRIPEVPWESSQSTQPNPGSAATPTFEEPGAITQQNPIVQDSSAPTSAASSRLSQASVDARPAVEVARRPKHRLVSKSAQTSDLPPNALRPQDQTGIAQLEPAQAGPQAATVASATVPVTSADLKLDPAERQRAINGAIANLTKYYIDPDVAKKMADALLAHEKNGDDDAATDGKVFADLLTRQMRDVSHDKYVVMVYTAIPMPENPPTPTPEEIARYRREMAENRCTFETVKILPHNVGYLKLNAFPDASICQTTAAAAMASVNSADAIIFDLRDNPGGYANMVALIATYLFDRPTHLNDFYNRGENSTEQSWTMPPVPGNRLADKPVFVLTSPSTFSAAEAFSYDLKMLKRATLVGETTSGRGHMGMGHRIDDHFTIRIPGVKVINPISKTNWEGRGVEPDVKVNVGDALATAEKLAETELQHKK